MCSNNFTTFVSELNLKVEILHVKVAFIIQATWHDFTLDKVGIAGKQSKIMPTRTQLNSSSERPEFFNTQKGPGSTIIHALVLCQIKKIDINILTYICFFMDRNWNPIEGFFALIISLSLSLIFLFLK